MILIFSPAWKLKRAIKKADKQKFLTKKQQHVFKFYGRFKVLNNDQLDAWRANGFIKKGFKKYKLTNIALYSTK